MWIDRIANLKHGRRKGVNFARCWAAMRRHRGNGSEYKTGAVASQCVFRLVDGPRPRRRVIAFVCSREVLFRWHLFGNEETAGPLRRGDKCIYVVNPPGCPHPPFKLTPFIREIAAKLKGPRSALDFFRGSRKDDVPHLTANRTIVEHSMVLTNSEVVDKYR